MWHPALLGYHSGLYDSTRLILMSESQSLLYYRPQSQKVLERYCIDDYEHSSSERGDVLFQTFFQTRVSILFGKCGESDTGRSTGNGTSWETFCSSLEVLVCGARITNWWENHRYTAWRRFSRSSRRELSFFRHPI